MITPGLYGTIQGSFIGVPRSTRFRIAAKVPEDGQYRVLLRGAATANKITVSAKPLGLNETIELQAKPGTLDFFDKQEVFTAARKPLDVSVYTNDELERLIPSDIVAVNNQFQYFDLGTVAAKPGKHTFYIAKEDNNPLLVEGILLIPEETYQNLDLPPNVRLLDAKTDLCCAAVGEAPSKED
jgi:hypothetical protein